MAVFKIAVALVFSFCAITVLQNYGGSTMTKYGVQNKCEAYMDAMERQAKLIKGINTKDLFERFAKRDKAATFDTDKFGYGHGMGIYACYCDKFSQYADAFQKDSLCYEYKRDSLLKELVLKSICVVIVLINVMLQTMVEYFVSHIGYHTHSKLSRMIMKYVFIA